MVRFIFGLLLGALLAIGSLALAMVEGSPLVRLELPRLAQLRPKLPGGEQFSASEVIRKTRNTIRAQLPEPEAREVNVVLDRDGAELYAGPEMARFGMSTVLLDQKIAKVTLPAYRVSDSRWRALTRCIEGQFSDYRVNILDDPPAQGDYMVLHVGGHPRQLGLSTRIRGISPLSGRVIPNATIFLFTHDKPEARDLCETAAHEIGHAIGLDHSRLCTDLMSYRDCGPKTFRERPAPCGEYKARTCFTGDEEQSSADVLERLVGLRPRDVS